MHNCERGKFEEITRDVPLGPMIHQIDRLMFRNLSSRVRAEGLDEVTLMHGWVMRYLYENREQVICQKDIEHTFDIRRSTVIQYYTADGEEGICRAQIRAGRCQTEMCQSDSKR